MPHASKKPHDGQGLAAESLSWEISRAELLEKSEVRAWSIARVSVAAALLSIAAVVVLAPFYKVIPVVFRVDNLTNEILEVQVGKASVPHSETMDKHWLASYVQTRERYVWTLLQTDYDSVLALSDEHVASDYKAIYSGANALDKKLGENTDIRVKLISVQLLPGEAGKAQVAWERTTREKGVDTERKRFVSTISYKYLPPEALTQEKQLIANPFGFRVDGYAVSTVLSGSGKDGKQ